MAHNQWPSDEELEKLPVRGFDGLMEYYSQEKWKAEKTRSAPARVLVKDTDFLELIEVLLEAKPSLRELKAYSSPRLGLLPPPVRREGADYYVYPDHLELLGTVLTLRKAYHLPLETIRELLERVPLDEHHVLSARVLSAADLLDLAKMGAAGFGLKDVVMAKACDVMLEDVLPSGQALTAATEPGNALQTLEEKLILGRLEEIKSWVESGRRQKFVRRESAEDFKNLARKHLIGKKISRKMAARRSRAGRGK
jgi:DNA-binding transcriptional MerR regulator